MSRDTSGTTSSRGASASSRCRTDAKPFLAASRRCPLPSGRGGSPLEKLPGFTSEGSRCRFSAAAVDRELRRVSVAQMVFGRRRNETDVRPRQEAHALQCAGVRSTAIDSPRNVVTAYSSRTMMPPRDINGRSARARRAAGARARATTKRQTSVHLQCSVYRRVRFVATRDASVEPEPGQTAPGVRNRRQVQPRETARRTSGCNTRTW